MKKVLNKVLKRNSKRPETGGRITNETVAEHRERVLAGGRKFKYPLQYTKRRVLVISTVIVIFATLSFIGFFSWQLYGLQSTDRFTYGLTQVVPVPVAKVGNEWVRYSNYLSSVRSAVHYLTTKEAVNFNSADGKRQLEFQKRLALDRAIQDTLVTQLAREQNISITGDELNDFVNKQISSNRLGVNEEVYKQVITDYYDWSFDEYKKSVYMQLLRKKVNAKLDAEGRERAEEILRQLAKAKVKDRTEAFAKLAKENSEDIVTGSTGGDVGFVSKSSEDPSGLIAAAAALKKGEFSGVIEGVDGFYIVQLTEKRDNGDIQFSKIFISYKVIDKKIAELKEQSLIQEYIKVEAIAEPANQ